jgi:hypothetical protein
VRFLQFAGSKATEYELMECCIVAHLTHVHQWCFLRIHGTLGSYHSSLSRALSHLATALQGLFGVRIPSLAWKKGREREQSSSAEMKPRQHFIFPMPKPRRREEKILGVPLFFARHGKARASRHWKARSTEIYLPSKREEKIFLKREQMHG